MQKHPAKGDLEIFILMAMIRMLVDEEGNISDRYTFDAFGNLIDSTGTTENNYLYCGEEYNGTTGLYYLRARYMNPEIGTFISMDKYQGTIHDLISLHKYLHFNANPVMNSDPTGYFTLSEQMEYLAIVGILMTAATLSISIVVNLRNFSQSSFGDRFKPQPIRELLDTVDNIIIDGISGIRDVTDGIIDDVISKVEGEETERKTNPTKGESKVWKKLDRVKGKEKNKWKWQR